ncbi:hypothetical protein ABBQ32_012308 [Trebouxia sp. C0010 RCD-2024]
MLCLYTSCLGFLGSQNGANTRPFLSALTSRSLQAVRVTPANRSTLQQGRRGVSHLSTAKSIVCQAATPQSTKLDSSMIWGDIMMLTATELASERLPKQVTGVLSLTLLAAWIGVAAAKGDYTVSKRRHSLSFEYAYAILLGMQQAAITWLLFVPTAMAMYACLVSHHLLDSSVFRIPPGCRTSPEGEVMLAALFTLMSWRGIYSSQMF